MTLFVAVVHSLFGYGADNGTEWKDTRVCLVIVTAHYHICYIYKNDVRAPMWPLGRIVKLLGLHPKFGIGFKKQRPLPR